MEEKYILQNAKTKQYLKGFKVNKPLWTDDGDEAAEYEELDALKIQRRLENLYSPAQKIRMVQKK